MTSGDAPRPPTPPEERPAPRVVAPEDLRDLPWQSLPGGVREKRKRIGSAVYRLLLYPAGYKDEKPRDRQQVGLVLKGRASLQIRSRQRPIRASQAFVLPAGLQHRLRVGRSPFLTFVVESGARRRKRRRGKGGGGKRAPQPEEKS